MLAIKIRDTLDIKYGREGNFLTHRYDTWEEAYSDMQSFATSGPTDLKYSIEEITQEQWDELVEEAYECFIDKQTPEHRALVDQVGGLLDKAIEDINREEEDPADYWKK